MTIRYTAKRVTLFFVTILFLVLYTFPAYALDTAFYSGNNILFYDETCDATSSTGLTSEVVPTSGAAIEVTLANANIKVGANQRERYTKTQDVFKPWNPDFVTLQEISAKTNLSYGNYKGFKKNHPDASRKTEDTGVQIAWDTTRWNRIGGDIEQIHPPTDPDTISNRDRYALWASFQNKEGAVVSVISTHWNVEAWKHPSRSKTQAQNMKALIEKLLPKGPVLVGGDFNYQYHAAGESYSPKTILGEANMKSVFKGNPGGEPVYVDWLFHSPQVQVEKNKDKKVFVKEGPQSQIANLSDHPFLVAKFKGTSGGIGPDTGALNINNASSSSAAGCTCPADNNTENTAGPSGLNEFLKALAMQESGGNPQAANPSSSARGKYQYITDTWRGVSKAYPPAQQYSSADKAPEPIQDAVVYIEYAQKWKTFDGSIFKLAVSHFYPAANSDPSLLDKHIGPASNPTPREYADSVVKKIKEGYGSDIPLKYSEAPDFNKYLTQAVGSEQDFSGVVSTSSSCGGSETVAEGGLTEEQAKKFMMNYGENKNGDSWTAATSGTGKPSANCAGGPLSNCTSFSAFFTNKFTDADFRGGDGSEVVNNMAAGGVPTGNKPKVFSIFSWSNGSYGHTGVVLGIHGDTIIVGHASCSSPGTGRGNGLEEGGGAGFIKVGKLSDNAAFWGTTPTKFAYPKNIDTAKIGEYVGGSISN